MSTIQPTARDRIANFARSAGHFVPDAQTAHQDLPPIMTPRGLSGWTERSPVFPPLLAVALGTWLYHHFMNLGAGLDINSMITLLLITALLLQRNLTSFSRAMTLAIGASIVANFVPSSGGQWIIQGFVTVTAAAELRASAQQGLLALGVGDQMANLLAPFWVGVIAGVARIDFRVIFGHCLVFAMLWFAIGVSIFTFVK